MTDQMNTPEDNQTPEQPPAEVQESRIPKQRFDEVNERMKKAERELERLQKEEQKRLEKEQLEAGQYTEIISTLTPKAEKAERLEAAIGKLLEAELQTVPEQYRHLVKGADAAEKLEWIAEARQSGLFAPPATAKPSAPNLNAAAGLSGGATPESASDEDRAWAQRLGMSLDVYLKQKKAIEQRE